MKEILLTSLILLPALAFAFMPEDEIALLQQASSGWSLGERIAFWGERFVDTPYDADPMGAYVTRRVIVADDRVDCMYHVFRSVELAVGKDPAGSLDVALDLRFHSKGAVEAGKVLNYDDRYRYGEDMIDSGKWGREITSAVGSPALVRGKHDGDLLPMIKKQDIHSVLPKLTNGDIVFFIKDPGKRENDEIVGHLGIIKIEGGDVYIISAFGQKNKGGRVKKVLMSEYSAGMPFVGIRVTRLE